MDELAGFDIFSIIGAIINFILILVVVRRLKLIVNNTRQPSNKPLVNSITEARLYEMTGDKKAALREYYRCYLLMENMGESLFYIDQKGITSKSLASKIEELGGLHPTNIYSDKEELIMIEININDNYSNGIEGFNVIGMEGTELILYTSTGVQFLNAGKDAKITIEKSALEGFLGRELRAFKLI